MRFEPAIDGVSHCERSAPKKLLAISAEVPWAGCDMGSSSFLELNGDCLSSVMLGLEIVTTKFE